MRPRGRLRGDDSGTAAVEFALVSVVLFTILFGIVQYGCCSSSARPRPRCSVRYLLAAVGIDDCATFAAEVWDRAEDNGLDPADVTAITTAYGADPAHPELTSPHVGSTVTVRMTYAPTLFDFPFIPTPSSLPVVATARVEQLGTYTGTC